MIRVVVCGTNAFVWNAEDVRTLREQHRIVGSLVGSHPRAPYQNTQLSLPLSLMPEEVTLLKHQGVVYLVDGSFDTTEPNDEVLEEYNKYKAEQYAGQNAIFIAERRENQRKFREKIAAGQDKRQLRAKVKRTKTADTDSNTDTNRDNVETVGSKVEAEKAPAKTGEPSDGGIPEEASGVLDPKKKPKEDLDLDDKPMPDEYTMIQLFHEEPWLPPRKPADWTYPTTPRDGLRYAVFSDLWRRGYYLSSGNKFGGDFLVYPGDPLMFHSFHIAICLPDDQILSAHDIVSMGRLGSNVRKTLLLCSIDSGEYSDSELDSGESTEVSGSNDEIFKDSASSVNYITLEWTGIN